MDLGEYNVTHACHFSCIISFELRRSGRRLTCLGLSGVDWSQRSQSLLGICSNRCLFWQSGYNDGDFNRFILETSQRDLHATPWQEICTYSSATDKVKQFGVARIELVEEPSCKILQIILITCLMSYFTLVFDNEYF